MKCDNLFVYSGLFMLIYTRVFFLCWCCCWLVGWAGWEFFSFIFIYLLFQNKIRIQRVQFDVWSMCVVYECGAYYFFFGCKPDTLSAWLIHLALSHLQNCGCEWIWSLYLILKPHNQCNVYSGTGHILCSW